MPTCSFLVADSILYFIYCTTVCSGFQTIARTLICLIFRLLGFRIFRAKHPCNTSIERTPPTAKNAGPTSTNDPREQPSSKFPLNRVCRHQRHDASLMARHGHRGAQAPDQLYACYPRYIIPDRTSSFPGLFSYLHTTNMLHRLARDLRIAMSYLTVVVIVAFD
jgi:hypothetical protein